MRPGNRIGVLPGGDGFAKRFWGQSLLAFAIKVGSAGLSFAMLVLLARAMDRVDYGLFAAVFSLAILLATIGSMGQRPLVLRFGAGYHENRSDALRRGVIQRGYAIVLIGCLVVGIAGALIYEMSGGTPDLTWIAAITALTLAWALVEYQSYIMRISNGVALSLMPRDIIWRSLICGLAWLAALDGLPPGPVGQPGAQGWVWIVAFSLSIVIGVQFVLGERRNPRDRVLGATEMRHAEWNAPMRHLWLSSIIVVAIHSLSVIMVERQISPEQAGPYFSALRIATLLTLFPMAISVISSPLLSRSQAVEDHAATQKVCVLAATIGGSFGVGGFVFFILAGGTLLRLFGDGFDDMKPALIILSAGFLVNTLAGPTGTLMEMSGHERAYFRALLITSTIGFVALPFAILRLGANGAALCIAAIAASWNIAAVIYCRRKIGIDPSIAIFILGKPVDPLFRR